MKKNFCLFVGVAAFAVFWVTTLPVRASEIDDRIQAAFNNSYVAKTYLKDDNVEVKSTDGVVTLTGTVKDDYHKSLAEETVASLPGVTSVNNQIEVKGDRPPEQSDAWLGVKVKTALLFHRNVSGTGTEVIVQDGVVTLRGEADNQVQKDLTTEYTQDVEGVKGVQNEMTVADPPRVKDETLKDKMDDASITAQAKMALMFHRSTSALKTKVETNDGVVTLKGTAKNEAEKDLATKIVKDIRGVRGVINTMDVE